MYRIFFSPIGYISPVWHSVLIFIGDFTMPNWCQNKLEITFAAERNEALHQALFSTNEVGRVELNFHNLIPMPAELDVGLVYGNREQLEQQYQHNIDHYGYKDWYDWCIANWGCKWNASSTVIFDECEEHISLYFDSAWTPPETWFKVLCEKFPDVDFTLSYYEPGCWFAGSMEADLEGDYFHTQISDDEIKLFAIDVFGESFEDNDVE